MTRRAAFFDVDGTLLTVTSLFRFLAYDCAVRGTPESYVDAMANLTALKAAGASRVEANRAFYTAFAGRSVADLVTGGRRWFALERALGGLFDPRVLTMLRAHSASGDLVVLLSGSFPPCLEPIARLTGADVVVCTEPEADGGRYTGRVAEPMVGRRKAVAAAAVAAGHASAPNRTCAREPRAMASVNRTRSSQAPPPARPSPSGRSTAPARPRSITRRSPRRAGGRAGSVRTRPGRSRRRRPSSPARA